MQRCVVTDNVPTSADDNARSGGGLYAQNATVAISDSSFSYNRATNNGGIWHLGHGGGAFLENCHATLERVTFDGNQANTYERGRGGGLCTKGGTLSLTDSTFVNNVAAGTGGGAGGGAYLRTDGALIDGNTFQTNAASQATNPTGSGGGLDIGNGWESTTSIYNVVVSHNTFDHNVADDGGGLVAKTAVSLTVSDNQFLGNSNGGFSTVAKSDTGAATPVLLRGNLFQDNTTPRKGGGALIYGAVDVLYNQFVDNHANTAGGGVYQEEISRNDNASAVYDGNLFRSNSATEGGGLYLRPEYSLNLRLSYRNMAFIDNTATSPAAPSFSGAMPTIRRPLSI